MKKLFFGILAMAALAACSTEEAIVTPKGEAIAFGNAFVDNSVRAIDPSYGATNGTTTINLTSFQLWGAVTGTSGNPVAIFEDDKVNGSVAANSVWTCEKTQYWVDKAKYNFAAVVNADTKTGSTKYDVTLGEDLLPATIKFSTPNNADVDLLYARSDNDIVGKLSGNDEVAFSFSHLLSKVKFTVNNSSNAAGYSYEIKNITIHGPRTGVYNVNSTSTETKWEEFGETATITLSDVEMEATTLTAESANEKLIIPSAVNVSFTVDIKCGNEVITTTNYTTSTAVTVKAGFAYNFAINVALGEMIQFTVASNPTWENGNTAPEDSDNKTNVPLTTTVNNSNN